MDIRLTLGEEEKTELVIQRNWLSGSFYYLENGDKHLLKSSGNLLAQFGLQLTRTFEFEVGKQEKHQIRLEQTRPLIFGGIRPHTYQLFVDGELYKSYSGS